MIKRLLTSSTLSKHHANKIVLPFNLHPNPNYFQNHVRTLITPNIHNLLSGEHGESKEEETENIHRRQQRMLESGKEKWTKVELFKFFSPYFRTWENKRLFGVSCGLLLISKGLSISAPYMLKIAVNSLGAASALQTVSMAILTYATMRVISSLAHELRANYVFHMTLNAMKSITIQMFGHIHSLDFLYHRSGTRDTMYAISRAIRNVENGLRFMLQALAPVIVEFVMLCGMLWAYCGGLYVLNILGTVGVYAVYTKWFAKKRQVYLRERQNTEKDQEFFLGESIANYDTVKYFLQEGAEEERFRGLIENYNRKATRVQYSWTTINFYQNCIFSVGLGINLLLSGYHCINGFLTPGDFIMLQTLFLQVWGPLSYLGTMFQQIEEAHIYLEEIIRIMGLTPKVAEIEHPIQYAGRGGSIEFRNVYFGYDKGNNEEREELFADLNFQIEAGKQTAIVGPSGFGKTTIFNLIFRLFDPDSGDIFIDNQNIRDLKQKSFRECITIVPQSAALFNSTIMFNLKFGNPKVSNEEVIEVTKKCQIHEQIMDFPLGYNTQVGELGSKLSGGERQRILIARALLKPNSQIFLFDEATSSLDSENEKKIVGELAQILEGKTCLYCAHRLTSIQNCDQIIVMGGGRVQEQGTHNQLIAQTNSKYLDYWNQFMGVSVS